MDKDEEHDGFWGLWVEIATREWMDGWMKDTERRKNRMSWLCSNLRQDKTEQNKITSRTKIETDKVNTLT